ncbi:MAG: efflux RND transporter permease subunit [Bacteroidales bacterium]|jgi:multidrug efflux pump subunit AcrB|nr:efflux RND transporter permease subunit [Bacteroidales bacterium]
MSLSELALKNKLLIKFLVVILIAGGILSFFKMGKMEDPELAIRVAQVVTIYPGASAFEVELQVTDPLEKAIHSMTGIGTIESKSTNDLSIIQVVLDVTLPEAEIQQHWDMLRRKIGDAAASLPAEAQTPIVMDDFGDVYGFFYVITTDGFSDIEFNDYAEKIKQELLLVEGVGKVTIYGEQKPCVYIDVKQDKLANLGVHFYELLMTIRGQNKMVYPGYFNSGDNRTRMEITDKYNSLDDIKNLLIEGHQHDQIRLNDIADVHDGIVQPTRNSMRYDGKPAIGLAVSMAPKHDITQVGKRIEMHLQQMKNKGSLPLGIDIHKVFFQSDRVNEAINTFLINLLESILVVVVLLMLTMGFRSGLILGSNLLIIVLGSFMALHFFDGTLQRVSLGALILAMGMLVDNAVVIIDGILIDLQQGMKRSQALVNMANKTAMPLLGATLIAILAFFPIFLSPDMTGVYVRDLFIVLTVSLIISWLLALVLVPMQANSLLKLKLKTKQKETKEPFTGKFYIGFRKMLYFMLRHQLLTLIIVIILLCLSIFGFRYVRQGFFPDFTYEQAYIEYKMPEGTTISKIKTDLQDMEERLLARKDICHVTSSYGGTPFRYNLVRSFAEPSLSYGELIVDFISPEAMEKALPELQKELSEHYPQAFVRIKKYNLMYKPFPIEVMFTGADPGVLKELSQQAEAIMEAEPAVMLVTNDWEPKAPVLKVNYNQPAARLMGVSRSDIAISLLAATEGIPIGYYYKGNTLEPLYLRSLDAHDNPVEDLSHVPVLTALPSLSSLLNKETVMGVFLGSKDMSAVISDVLQPALVSQVSDGISLEWDDLVVRRYNGERSIRAQCNNMFGYTPEQSRNAIKNKIEQIPLPAGYKLEWMGEAQASAESTRYLFANLPLAIVMMVIILIMLFKDAKKPMIIFLCIPLAVIGVVGGLLISGKEFGFVAIVGALGLIGMMIKNGVVLLDEVTQLTASGTPPVEALLMASSSRLRPVLMASGTTVVGMIPLLSDVLFGSLAVTIMGGLMVGTIITLLIIPVLYALFFRIKIERK